MRYGSLFSGIGGFDLGFDRAGLTCEFQVEIDPFCRRVLAKHWPDVRRHDDIRTFPPTDPGEWAVDVLCGGFPCQDISNAGKRVGIDGERSGLWGEYARVVRQLRPRYVVVENVSALLARGLERVLGDLAACGYDAEWDCLPAAAFGAPHRRDRLFVVAYPDGRRLRGSDPDGEDGGEVPPQGPVRFFHRGDGQPSVSDPDGERPGLGRWLEQPGEAAAGGGVHQWRTEPDVGRVADGVPGRVDRLRGLGNAVVPQVAQWIGERLMEVANARY